MDEIHFISPVQALRKLTYLNQPTVTTQARNTDVMITQVIAVLSMPSPTNNLILIPDAS